MRFLRLWALTVGGEAGVREYLMNLSADIDLTFALAGQSGVGGMSPQALRQLPQGVCQ